MRKLLAVLAAGGLLIAANIPAKAGLPQVVFEDAEGDAGIAAEDIALAPATEQGMDLVSSSLARVKKDLIFSVTMAGMPADGPPPEAFRMLYHFTVDGVEWRFTVKSLDVGKPDVVAQTGVDRIGTIYEGLFRLEQCVDDTTLPITLVNCNPVSYEEGSFDTASATVTWKVPLATIGAKTGSIIGPTASATTDPPCQICWVAHKAERSLIPSTVIDYADLTTPYKLPKK